MHTAVKIALTAVSIAAIAWPLLFWGEPAQTATHRRGEHAYPTTEQLEQPPIYNRLEHLPICW